MPRGPFVVELRNGSLFRGPRSDRGGTLGEAMRFQQAKHATEYIDARAPWVWFSGACVMSIDRLERRGYSAQTGGAS